MSSLPTIMEEFSADQDFKKICAFQNLSFYMTYIPENVEQEEYISFLKSKKVSSVVRTRENSFNWMSTIAGISEVIVNFSDPIPDGFVLDLLMLSMKQYMFEKLPVSIAIEETVSGAYVLVYVLIELGFDWKKALKQINKTGLKLEKLQIDFLHYKSHELKQLREKKTCNIS